MDTIAVMTRALLTALALVIACACQEPPTCDGVPVGGLAECAGPMAAFCRLETSDGSCYAEWSPCVNGEPVCEDGSAPACYSRSIDVCGEDPRPDGPACEARNGSPLAAPECVGGGLPYCVTSSGCTNNSPPLCDTDGPTCGAGETVQCLEAAPPSC